MRLLVLVGLAAASLLWSGVVGAPEPVPVVPLDSTNNTDNTNNPSTLPALSQTIPPDDSVSTSVIGGPLVSSDESGRLPPEREGQKGEVNGVKSTSTLSSDPMGGEPEGVVASNSSPDIQSTDTSINESTPSLPSSVDSALSPPINNEGGDTEELDAPYIPLSESITSSSKDPEIGHAERVQDFKELGGDEATLNAHGAAKVKEMHKAHMLQNVDAEEVANMNSEELTKHYHKTAHPQLVKAHEAHKAAKVEKKANLDSKWEKPALKKELVAAIGYLQKYKLLPTTFKLTEPVTHAEVDTVVAAARRSLNAEMAKQGKSGGRPANDEALLGVTLRELPHMSDKTVIEHFNKMHDPTHAAHKTAKAKAPLKLHMTPIAKKARNFLLIVTSKKDTELTTQPAVEEAAKAYVEHHKKAHNGTLKGSPLQQFLGLVKSHLKNLGQIGELVAVKEELLQLHMNPTLTKTHVPHTEAALETEDAIVKGARLVLEAEQPANKTTIGKMSEPDVLTAFLKAHGPKAKKVAAKKAAGGKNGH